jgi:3-hydroxyisobutyrate dehydrogenase-like beta-hydroxyacid dehydrogenase
MPYILKRDFKALFPLKWMHKDMTLILESGTELNVPLPATALVRELFGASMARGHGEDDYCSAVTLLEEWAHVKVKG